MAALFQDIRYGIRMMAKNASFTFFVVAVLALGIAASTSIFMADAIRQQVWAVDNPLEELVQASIR